MGVAVEPRLLKAPKSVGTHGDNAIKFLDAIGVNLFDWQKACLRHLLAVDENGRWAATEAGLLTARQNGKSELLAAYVLCHLFLLPEEGDRPKTILFSAHEYRTATEIYRRIKGVIESSPKLQERTANIYDSSGRQEIVLKKRKKQKAGNAVKFVARSKNSGRGFSGSIIVADEAQEWAVSSYESMAYIQSTYSTKQLLMTGTVPTEENEYEVFEGIRDRGRSTDKSKNSKTLWMEYSPEGSENYVTSQDIDPYSEEAWEQSNPSLDILISRDTVREQLDRDTSAGKEGFLRERLSVWPRKPEELEETRNDVDLELWSEASRNNPTPMHGEKITLAVQVSDNGSHASISAASEQPDGTIYVEHVHSQLQTLWVPGKLKALMSEMGASSLILDEKKCAAIVPDLKRERLKYFSARPSEVAGAYALFVELANNAKLVHRGQASLTESVKNATTRNIGSYGMTWEQGNPNESITQVQSATLAVYGVKHAAGIAKPKAKVRGFR